MEKTLAIIKPDGMKHKDKILKRIKSMGLKIASQRKEKIKINIAAEFYKHVELKHGKAIYQSLIDYMTSDEVMLLVLQGDNAVSRLRKITGFTDPERAEKGTIRGDLGIDKMRIADAEQRTTKNVIHSSGTVEEAQKEIAFFFN
jgi:nucleoside-diphosphate kinase